MPRGASEKLGGWGQQGPAPAHRLSVEVSKYSALQHSMLIWCPNKFMGASGAIVKKKGLSVCPH